MRRLIVALTLLLAAPLPAAAQSVYATLNAGGTAVTGLFANPQPQLPGFAQLSASDARVVAFQNAAAAPAALAQHLAQGIAITSTGTPAVNGTYAIDDASRANITAVAASINAGMGFPQEVTAYQYPDIAGTLHGFPSTTIFLNFAKATRDLYDAEVKAAQQQAGGGTPSWPANAVTIP